MGLSASMDRSGSYIKMANQMIALGVNPPQPVNMLKSATDVATLGALMQDVQGARGVQEAIAGGMAPTDPRLLQYGKRGQATYSAALQGRSAELDMAGKKADLIGSAANFVLNNPTPENFNSAVSNLVRLGVYTPEEGQEALAEVQADPSRIRLIAEQQARQALSVKDQLMQMYSQDVGGAVQVMGVDPLTGRPQVLSRTGKSVSPSAALAAQTAQNRLAFDAMKFEYERANPNRELRQAADGTIYGIDKRTMEAVPVTMEAPTANMLGQVEVGAMPAEGGVPMETATPSPERVPFVGARAPQAFERKVDQLGAESVFKEAETAIPAAQEAAVTLPKLYETLEVLESGQPITGFGANLLLDLERARAQFTQDKEAGERVENTEYLRSLLGSEVFGAIQQLGIGARGLDTPAEREFLLRVMTGDIPMNAETLKRMVNLRVKTLEGAIDRTNQKIEKGDFDIYFEGRRQDKQTIEKPTREAGAAQLTQEDRAALNWANSNPNDPRAAEIKRRLGM